MSTQTNSDKKSKSQQESSNTTDSKNSLIYFELVENTPFGIVTIEGKSFGVIGQNRITEEYDDLEKVREDLNKIDWNKITNVVWNICELYWKAKLIHEKSEENE